MGVLLLILWDMAEIIQQSRRRNSLATNCVRWVLAASALGSFLCSSLCPVCTSSSAHPRTRAL